MGECGVLQTLLQRAPVSFEFPARGFFCKCDQDVCSIKRVERLSVGLDSITPPRRGEAPAPGIKDLVKSDASVWIMPAAVDDALRGDSGIQQRLVEIVPDAS